MIPKQQIKEFLLQTIDGAKIVSGGTEIAAPCPICGERRPKLYIGPFDDSDNRGWFHFPDYEYRHPH